MAWIDFERDWSYQWPLVWQAKSLVDHRLAIGADTHALLVEQRCLREAQTNLNIPWMFYNAVVVELEGRL